MNFDEYVFLWTLIHRPYHAVAFSSSWEAAWMKDISLIPVTESILYLTKKYGTSPSFNTLKEYLIDNNGEEVFNNRYKNILDQLILINPDDSHVGYTVDKAKEIAIVRSFENFISSYSFAEARENYKGKEILKDVNDWLGKFLGNQDEETMPIDEAVIKLFDDSSKIKREPVSSGIVTIDRFTSGGLRPGNLGIFLAPTGAGKSTILMNIAYKASLIGNSNVWFVSNELTMAEQTERFLGRMTGVSMNAIMDDPIVAKNNSLLNKYWNEYKIQDHLMLTTILKSFSAADLEASLMRRKAITGWSPDLLVLDYIERMHPNRTNFGEQEWTTYGKIAGDLIQLAKKHGMAVWTAAQTNRTGLQKNANIDLSSGQASIRHFQEAAYVITLQKQPIPGEEETREAFKLKVEKARHSRNEGRTIYLEVDLDKMLVTDKELDFTVELEPSNNGKNKTIKRIS